MKTMIQRENGVVTVQLTGYLDFETTQPFRENLNDLIEDTKSSQIIFDLRELNFVGSSGITAFVQALRDFNERAQNKPCYVNVKSEFRRIIDAFDTGHSFIFTDFHSDKRGIRSLDN